MKLKSPLLQDHIYLTLLANLTLPFTYLHILYFFAKITLQVTYQLFTDSYYVRHCAWDWDERMSREPLYFRSSQKIWMSKYIITILNCGRKNNGFPKTSMSESPKSLDTLRHMAKRNEGCKWIKVANTLTLK